MEAKNNENDPEVVQLQAAVRVHSSAREKGANCKPPTAALHLLQSAAGRWCSDGWKCIQKVKSPANKTRLDSVWSRHFNYELTT